MRLPEFVQDLMQGDAYPWHPAEVELIETHISWVFLAGDRVVKVKRPVDLGFVDFTDIRQRYAACQDEVRLNRRLSNGVYLGVVPITKSNGRHRVDGEGDQVEWATLMRRLPADRMLDALVARKAVPEHAADLLAEKLIPFHRDQAPVCENFVTKALAVVTENLDQLREVAEGVIELEQLALVDFGMRSFIDQERATLARRAATLVREGHGDLRAEHICFEANGSVQIFDCVEFSREIRCADVASDIAFLLMDLRRLGEPGLARDILQRYQAAGVDLPDGIVRFYIAHRALVRAKVACLEIRVVDSDRRQSHVAEAVDYMHLATASALPARSVIVAVTGLSGTGKSTVAAALARALDAPVHASDVVRKELAEIPPEARATAAWQQGIYSAEWSSRTYERLRELARGDVSAGRPTVLDATFLDGSERQRLADLAAEERVPLVLVEIGCDEETALRRIRARAEQSGTISDATEEIYLRQRERLAREPVPVPRGAIHLIVDTTPDGPVNIAPVLRQMLRGGILAETASG